MSELTRIHFLQYAAYADGSIFTGAPAAPLKFLRPSNNPTIDTGFTYPERAFQTGNNENLPALRGQQSLSVSDLSFALYGLSGGGAGVGVSSATLDTCCSELVSCLTGSLPEDNEGDTTDALAPGSGNIVTVAAPPGAPVTDGGGMLVKEATSGKYVAREVVALAGADYTVDRDLTDDTGASGAPEAGSDIYAARSFYFDNANENSTHFYFDTETEGSRKKLEGCYSSASIQFPAGQYAGLNLSGIQCTRWVDDIKANPTYIEPDRGDNMVVTDSPFWIGNTQYQAFDFSLDFGIAMSERRNEAADNGTSGFVATNRMPVLSGKIRLGALTGPDEMTDAIMEGFRGAENFSTTTADIALQVGRSAGSCIYIRFPAGQLRLIKEDSNGQRCLGFTCTATESPNQDTIPGACRIHIF